MERFKASGEDYIDIFFCHRYDVFTRTDETVRALSDLVQQGKILYWGTSMWNIAIRSLQAQRCPAPIQSLDAGRLHGQCIKCS